MGSCLSSNHEEREYYAPTPYRPSYTNKSVIVITNPVVPRVTTSLSDDKICFGKFRCGICRHYWASYRAWKDVEQKCEKCRISTRPYFTRSLTRKEMDKKTNDPDKAHKTELCSKCREIGGNCKALAVGREMI